MSASWIAEVLLRIFFFHSCELVSLFHNEEDATEAASKRVESFHVAIVEVISFYIIFRRS